MANGFASLNQNNPLAGPVPGVARSRGQGSGPVAGGGTYGSGSASTASRGADAARDAMRELGVPSFADLFKQFGGGGGVTEFGNSGAAGEGAAFAKGQLNDWRTNLSSLQAQLSARQAQGYGQAGPNPFQASFRASQREYQDPTSSSAFRSAMNLASEKTAAAVDEEQRQGADAAMRRGFSGGYDPRQGGVDRMRALSEAGFAGVDQIRQEALDKYKTDAAGFGQANQVDSEMRKGRYDTDVGALTSLYNSGMSGYNAGLGAYSDLTKTQAELPTKMLSAISPFYGSLLGGASDFYKTSVGASEFDTEQRSSELAYQRQQSEARRQRIALQSGRG